MNIPKTCKTIMALLLGVLIFAIAFKATDIAFCIVQAAKPEPAPAIIRCDGYQFCSCYKDWWNYPVPCCETKGDITVYYIWDTWGNTWAGSFSGKRSLKAFKNKAEYIKAADAAIAAQGGPLPVIEETKPMSVPGGAMLATDGLSQFWVWLDADRKHQHRLPINLATGYPL